MSTDYPTVVGFVQFDPISRDVNGQQVREITVNAVGFNDGDQGQAPVRVSLWESHEDVEVAKNDFVAVQGKYTQRQSGDRTYHNMNASTLLVLAPAPQKAREAVRKTPAGTGAVTKKRVF